MMEMPHQEHLFEHIKQNSRYARRMFGSQRNQYQGQTVAICGAGPSLRDYVTSPQPYTDQVWACNSAIRFLKSKNMRVTHAFGIDQGEAMIDDWTPLYDVTYLIASSVHPKLVKYLRTNNRRIRWFHNFLGLHDPEGWTPPPGCMVCLGTPERHEEVQATYPHEAKPISYEMWLYQNIFASSCVPAYGLNSVARAIGVALYVGFDQILVYGSDCACAPDNPPIPLIGTPEYEAWTKQVVVYADGRTVWDVYGPNGTMIECGGADFIEAREIDGVWQPVWRRWITRADMVVTAQHLVQIVKENPSVQLIGDILPNKLLHWQPEDWARAQGGRGVPGMDGKGAVVGFVVHPELEKQLAGT